VGVRRCEGCGLDFCESRVGENAREFLGSRWGSLVCDDFAGYKAGFAHGVTKAGCMAHARRKFFDLHASSKSQVAESALQQIAMIYEIERQLQGLTPDERQRIRQTRSRPLLDALQQWMLLTREKITDGSATAKALDYSLKRWAALTRFVDDRRLPVDNNWIENQIRPIALGSNNWLFAGSLRAVKRSAAVMSLIRSAKLNGHDPYVYLKGCAGAAAYTAGPPDWGVAAASLDACRLKGATPKMIAFRHEHAQ
jgi:transposase